MKTLHDFHVHSYSSCSICPSQLRNGKLINNNVNMLSSKHFEGFEKKKFGSFSDWCPSVSRVCLVISKSSTPSDLRKNCLIQHQKINEQTSSILHHFIFRFRLFLNSEITECTTFVLYCALLIVLHSKMSPKYNWESKTSCCIT